MTDRPAVTSGNTQIPSPFLSEEGFRRWSDAVGQDQQFVVATRRVHFAVQLHCGQESLTLMVTPGQLARVEPDSAEGVGSPLVLTGTVAAWSRFLAPVPPRFHTDVIGMQRRTEEFSVGGDTDLLHRHLRVLHRLFEVARLTGAEHG